MDITVHITSLYPCFEGIRTWLVYPFQTSNAINSFLTARRMRRYCTAMYTWRITYNLNAFTRRRHQLRNAPLTAG